MNMMENAIRIKELSDRIFPEVVEWRRHIHQNPELSFQERETAAFVARKLMGWGIPCRQGIGGFGVTAQIGPESGPTIALRADMDALPIQERNEVPYCSKNEGVMHACGHDVHTSSLLGTAWILKQIEEELSGRVILVFQPAEEKLPGGASLMLRDGLFGTRMPDAIFAQHVHPSLEVGKVGFRAGPYMASADELYITVKGRGGHGALPHDCIDPVSMTAQLITALQQLVSRYADPLTPSVLTIGKIASEGGATNVIPNVVHLEGTFRTLDDEWREEAHKRMTHMAKGLIEGQGGACEFKIVKGYPALHNDIRLTEQAIAGARQYLGEENVVNLDQRMTAEDFAWFAREMPGCFYRLGTGNTQRSLNSPVHTDTFDVDEECLRTSIGLMAWLTINNLENKRQMKRE